MPKYTFKCESCGKEEQRYHAPSVTKIDCFCGSKMSRLPVRLLGMDVTELVDSNRNVKWKQDQEEMLRERSMDYFYEREVPRLINEYSLRVCLEEGWLYYDEKGELQVRKKPPQKD